MSEYKTFEELKYCKFCDKEKPIKEFCKSGSFIKNICRECHNKKQKQIYQNSKKVEQLQNQLQQKENVIKEVREYITYWHYRNDFRVNSFTTGVKEELLEILDKGE